MARAAARLHGRDGTARGLAANLDVSRSGAERVAADAADATCSPTGRAGAVRRDAPRRARVHPAAAVAGRYPAAQSIDRRGDEAPVGTERLADLLTVGRVATRRSQ